MLEGLRGSGSTHAVMLLSIQELYLYSALITFVLIM